MNFPRLGHGHSGDCCRRPERDGPPDPGGKRNDRPRLAQCCPAGSAHLRRRHRLWRRAPSQSAYTRSISSPSCPPGRGRSGELLPGSRPASPLWNRQPRSSPGPGSPSSCRHLSSQTPGRVPARFSSPEAGMSVPLKDAGPGDLLLHGGSPAAPAAISPPAAPAPRLTSSGP